MMIWFAVVLAVIVGIAMGAVFHAWIMKNTVATKDEIEGWKSDLEHALATDAAGAKIKMTALILRLKAKL